jgi:hypothetical protein
MRRAAVTETPDRRPARHWTVAGAIGIVLFGILQGLAIVTGPGNPWPVPWYVEVGIVVSGIGLYLLIHAGVRRAHRR